MKRLVRRHAAGSILAALIFSVPAAGLDTAEEIRQCVQDNLPERTSRQEIELTSEDRAGGRRTLEAKLHWKRDDDETTRVHIRVESPIDLRDSTYLLIEKPDEDEMFMYLPKLQKVRRITSGMLSDQLWGTDFSYEDIRQLQGITVDGASERLPDTEVGGRPAYVLEIVPSGEEPSSYRRIVSAVDRETCVALRTEFFERGDEPRKVLTADPDEIRAVKGRWVAHRFEMRDVRDETRSWLVIRKIANDVSVAGNLFNPTLLGRSR